jgi:hypothetical protein
LFWPAYRKAATLEASVNSFINTGLFPLTDIFQDLEFACHGMDESQDKSTGGAGNEISSPGTSNVSFHNASGGKFISPADVRPIPHLTAKCSALIDQAKQSRASCAELLASPCRKQLRECQEMKSLSLSKKPAIKGYLEQEVKGLQRKVKYA